MKFRLSSYVLSLCISVAMNQACAQEPKGPDLRLANFPAYATTLSPEHLAQVRAAVGEILALARGGKPVFVLTIGHADFDAKGRAFEDRVSESRAQSALSALRSEFNTAATDAKLAPVRANVDFWEVTAAGTREPVVKAPRNEDERRQNRRVEFFWWTDEATGIALKRRFYGK